MADIRPDKNGKIKQSQKRLKHYLRQLKNVNTLTVMERNLLLVNALTALLRIEMGRLNIDEDESEVPL